MASDNIEGTVTDTQGNPLEDATIYVFVEQNTEPDGTQFTGVKTSTDSNGDFVLKDHPAADGTSQEWHVAGYYQDGTGEFNALSKPSVEASVGPAFPSSTVLQYFATSWTQGDATWDDITNTANQPLSGNPQSGTLSDGSEYVGFDGNDDYGRITLPSDLEGNSLERCSFEIAFQTTTTSTISNIMGVAQSGMEWFVEINRNTSFNFDDGQIYTYLRDSDGELLGGEPSTSLNLNDGNRHDLTISYDGPNNEISYIVDGTSYSSTYSSTDNPDNFGTWNQDIAIAADNNGGSFSRETDIDIGAIRFHNEFLTSQTISNY